MSSFRLTPLCRVAARAAVSQQPHLHLRPSTMNMATMATIQHTRNSTIAIPLSSLHILSTPSSSRYFSTKEKSEATKEKPIIPGVGKGKTSTGIVGLAVEPDWYNVILKKFQFLLDTMEESDMPETAQYRIDVTKWANYVIATTKANPDNPEAVEEAVNMGQVEELIEMADDEMIAMDVYLKSRMWELVEEANKAFTIVYNPDPMKDEMGPDGDPLVQEQLRKGNEAMQQETKK